jgi:hypothetical protein
VSNTVIHLPGYADILRADKAEIVEQVRTLQQALNRIYAMLGMATSKIDAEGAKATHGYNTAEEWLSEALHCSPAEAGRIARRGRAVNPSRTLDGTVVPAIAPLAGAAAREGALSPAHVDVIAKTMAKIPADVSDDDRVAGEKILVDLAREVKPHAVAAAGDRLLDTLNPDGSEPKDPLPDRPKRELHFQEHRDGTAGFRGVLDNLTYAQFRSVLDPLAKPRSTPEEPRDGRAVWERNADALAEIIGLAMAAPDIPTHAGDRVHVSVTVDYQTLMTGIGTATLDYGGVISAAEARMLACDCELIPAVMGSTSEEMDLGRKVRLITAGQRRRLVLRERGCTFPNCSRKAKHCDGHHIIYWLKGGPTNIGNLTLLCAHHHRIIHRGDWTIVMAADGRPDFIPPESLDPERRPRRNTVFL